VSFVVDTLFPYAAARLGAFLREQATNPHVQQLVNEATQAWQQDDDLQAQALWEQDHGPGRERAVESYLQLLIRQDRKLTALKDLQGLIWASGYACGDLVAPLYADVPAALKRWHAAGIKLAVYSSGSVPAQKLLYGHTPSGDLRPLFTHWFDTRTGSKQVRESYQEIASAMQVKPGQVLFISDALAECQAAAQCGMSVLFSDRAGNPNRDPGQFEKVSDYSTLVLEPYMKS